MPDRHLAEIPKADLSQEGPLPASRALTIVPAERGLAPARPMAGFLTQLIACDRRIGIYRSARRAAPSDAAACYAHHAPAQAAAFQRVV